MNIVWNILSCLLDLLICISFSPKTPVAFSLDFWFYYFWFFDGRNMQIISSYSSSSAVEAIFV